ncbi:hypothetical protein TRSC58_07397 [Trypanosoma rangeli SC58]|uniref:Uncharacterized protein n=1 Tax=Trypanosoma rangeli SC58 TaxID=429131 RepID=A0A061IS11_TRYRA|nr:hypothetical protein TRSC58_07397 [Trypanosoma rangeli SC58]
MPMQKKKTSVAGHQREEKTTKYISPTTPRHELHTQRKRGKQWNEISLFLHINFYSATLPHNSLFRPHQGT